MKRYTDTEKWSDAFFRKLAPKHKLLYLYILDNCDSIGVWKADLELASFQIGFSYDYNDLEVLSDKICIIDPNKVFVKNFVKFQYGELNSKNPIHKKMIEKLKTIKLKETDKINNKLIINDDELEVYDEFEQKIIKLYLELVNHKNVSKYDLQIYKELAENYGFERLSEAMRIAKEQGKFNLAYIKGILTNKKRSKDIWKE